jgi:hypothetical protein
MISFGSKRKGIATSAGLIIRKLTSKIEPPSKVRSMHPFMKATQSAA